MFLKLTNPKNPQTKQKAEKKGWGFCETLKEEIEGGTSEHWKLSNKIIGPYVSGVFEET